MKSNLQTPRAHGFTLIELVIAIVVVAILAAIAIPSYRHAIEKSRRTDARTAVLDLAAREQRYYGTQNSFTTVFADLGYAPAGQMPTSVTVGSGYYTVALGPAIATDPPTFTVTATATGAQLDDTGCRTFTVDNTGLQKAYDSSGNDNTTTCWE
ncbi:MAG: type IV pilin protein [Steroidobacteraceae bacterium]